MRSGEAGVLFHVAIDGRDTWSGRLAAPNVKRTDGPFATLERARDAIRALKGDKELKQPVTVRVRGGKYYLDDALTLGPEDSGTRECPVTYKAYAGEKPIISGGRRITGWKPYKDKILQCEVPGTKGGKWKFRQLFLNGERQIRARYPNFDPKNPLYGGWARIEGPAEEGSKVAFRYKAGEFPRRWAKPTEGEVNIWPFADWGDNCIIPIRSIDEERGVITLTHPTKNFDITPWFFPTQFKPGNRFYVENLLEELDQPGEWCLDSEEGILYFWPPCENLEKAEVVAPYLDCLIDLRAAYVTISGFTFTETTYRGDSTHPTGVEGVGAMFPEVGWQYCGEAIHLQNAEHCIIEDNRIYAVGGNGIYLQQYNARNHIRYNEISYAGANGAVLAGGKVIKAQDRPEHPVANEVTDNEIHHCGYFNKYTAGIFLGRSEANLIAHNLIHDLPHHGINLGNDGYGRNIVEYNKIHHVCLETTDNGGINVWMEGPRDSERSGDIIRYNYIADNARPPETAARGIYLDGDTSNCFVYGNILVRNEHGGVFINGGKNNIVENNVIVSKFLAHTGTGTSWYLDHFCTGNFFCRNILYRTGEEGPFYSNTLTKGTLRALAQCDYNLFYAKGGGEATINVSWGTGVRQGMEQHTNETMSLSHWQETTGFEAHSKVADPLFVDPDKDDYRLKPDSPALKLGFQPIDVSRIGIRKRTAK